MKYTGFWYLPLSIIALIQLSSCEPKSVTTDPEYLSNSSRKWIPFTGNENAVFVYDTSEITFVADPKKIYYETARYMTDESGFFKPQQDYYADFERQYLDFTSEVTPYFINYYLERNKTELGDFDVLKVSIGDGDYYKNEMKIVLYESDHSDKGENYSFKKQLTLNNIIFDSVFYWKQERRPFEIYYTKKQGVVAFKLSSQEIWTLKQE